ncbi:MAG TPA: hypothetical protein V6C63_00935 [Allocoleopsis sp.]
MAQLVFPLLFAIARALTIPRLSNMTIKTALSLSPLYLGMMIVCLSAVTLPAMAKGKPQKQQKQPKIEQPAEQPTSTTPSVSPLCQPLNPSVPQPSVILPQPGPTALPQTRGSEISPEKSSSKAPNLRSNKGGKLRGQARAQYVQQLNQAKKQQRLAGQIPNACAGLPQLPPQRTPTPSTSTNPTS